MSINFLDIKYVIIFSLVHYSIPMVLKSPKYYTSRYIKKLSKTTLYINNPYKARKKFEFNYQDWEEKKTDIYDYLLPTTNQKSSTKSNISNETSPKYIFYSKIPTDPILESSQYNNTLYSLSATYPTLPFNESTPDTSLSSPFIKPTPLSILPSFSTPYNTTTTLTPEVSTADTITETMTSVTVPVKQSIRNELLDAKVKLRKGYFISSIYVLLKIIERKKNEDLTPLFAGFQGEFIRLKSNDHLPLLTPMVLSVLTFLVLEMTKVPVELIQTQAKYAREFLENQSEALDSDALAAFHIVDTIYKEEIYNRTLDSLTDIQNFPNVSKSATKVAEETLAAYILLPYTRIVLASKEKLLQTKIHNFVEKRMSDDENRIKKLYFRNTVKITTAMTASSKNITKFRGKNYTKANTRTKFTWPTIFTEPATTNSSKTDASYITDRRIMKNLGHKMIGYKKKMRKLKSQKTKLKTTRRMTNTITTTTTIVIPLRVTSKYYMKKDLKKKQYKMKIRTSKTAKFLWKNVKKKQYKMKIRTSKTTKFYWKNVKKKQYKMKNRTSKKVKTKKNYNFRKKNMIIDNLDVKKYTLSNDASDNDGYYSAIEDVDETEAHKSNNFAKSITPTKLKSLIKFKAIKNYITNHMLYNNNNIIDGEESKMEIDDNNIIRKFDNKRDSSDSNTNSNLQVYLNDALFHTNNLTIDRRFITKKVNHLLKTDSFSDYEAILKGNIYKVFGYSNDFAKQLRAIF